MVDGHVVTSQGPGTSLQFALKLVEQLHLTLTLTLTPTPTPTPTLTSTPTLTLTQGREALRRGEGQGDRGPDAHHLGLMDRDLGLSQLGAQELLLLLWW